MAEVSDDDYEPPVDTVFDREEEARGYMPVEPPIDSAPHLCECGRVIEDVDEGWCRKCLALGPEPAIGPPFDAPRNRCWNQGGDDPVPEPAIGPPSDCDCPCHQTEAGWSHWLSCCRHPWPAVEPPSDFPGPLYERCDDPECPDAYAYRDPFPIVDHYHFIVKERRDGTCSTD